MTSITNNPMNVVAVAKGVSTKSLSAARDHITPGTHVIDVTVRIHGEVEVGQPFLQTFPAAVPWEVLCKLAFDKLNAATIASIITEVHDAQQAGEVPALLEQVNETCKDATIDLIETLKAATEKTARGKINARLVADVVGD